MPEVGELQRGISPYWTESELDEVLDPTGNVIVSDEKIQRDRLKDAIEAEQGEVEDLRELLPAVVGWKNKRTAIALWAGHVERANEIRASPGEYTSAKSAEAALIERFSQPVYEQLDRSKADLVDGILPVVRASPLSRPRPEIWDDDERARERIRWVLDEHVDRIDWSRRGD